MKTTFIISFIDYNYYYNLSVFNTRYLYYKGVLIYFSFNNYLFVFLKCLKE